MVRLILSKFYDIFSSTLVSRNYSRFFIYLCVASSIIYGSIVIVQKCVSESGLKKHNLFSMTGSIVKTKKAQFSNEELKNMSVLGRWLLAPEISLPSAINKRRDPYLILLWKHGPFLERRHIKRFTNTKFSPWEGCSVNDCSLSYDSRDLDKADAVLFHLHMTKSVKDLPVRTRWDQRWIFLTDESPMHTFLYKGQKLSNYNGIFNWSMSYRIDSDIPVPYGRTLSISSTNCSLCNMTYLRDTLIKSKTKLVAILASNCNSKNQRWEYISSLKTLLDNDLDVYGHCMNGNRTACPGHFNSDCSILNAYKFYLAFENSNCKEYLTEKVFWNGYKKLSVPVIMGSSKSDCERLLPPGSYLHVNDFDNPGHLAEYLRYLDRNINRYIELHAWRQYYEVLNEHGYFGSASRHYCRICEALHYNSRENKVYRDLDDFWGEKKFCS